jgi:hypothetical protein
LSRSTAYYPIQIKQPTQEEIDIKNAIDQIHFNEPAYGCRRIQRNLEALGFTIGLKLTLRYMQEMDIVAFYPGPNRVNGIYGNGLTPTSFGMLVSLTGTRFGGLILRIVVHRQDLCILWLLLTGILGLLWDGH